MSINSDRLRRRLEELSRLTDPDRPWTRRSFSDLFLQGREWLAREFRKAGLETAVDGGGNLVGRRPGANAALAPIVLGSHSDTVPSGGRFDGILGVVAGLEIAQSLRDNSVALQHPLDIVDFLAEEPSEFGVSCIGSRAFVGALDMQMLGAKRADGFTLAEGLARVGGRPDELTKPLRPPGSIAAYVELHIEQGPVLESRNIPIGVVTNIVGIRRVLLTVEGQPDHAGTTPMTLRRDALVGASRIIDATYRKAGALSGNPHYVVATIGRLDLTPNAINAVPGRVEMVLEVRSDENDILTSFPEEIRRGAERDLADLGLALTMTPISHALPTNCSPRIEDIIEEAAAATGFPSLRLPSGAGHDGVFVSKSGPIGMIFIPCLDGRSHCPEEWAEPRQTADGALVLYETVLRLDRALE